MMKIKKLQLLQSKYFLTYLEGVEIQYEVTCNIDSVGRHSGVNAVQFINNTLIITPEYRGGDEYTIGVKAYISNSYLSNVIKVQEEPMPRITLKDDVVLPVIYNGTSNNSMLINAASYLNYHPYVINYEISCNFISSITHSNYPDLTDSTKFDTNTGVSIFDAD